MMILSLFWFSSLILQVKKKLRGSKLQGCWLYIKCKYWLLWYSSCFFPNVTVQDIYLIFFQCSLLLLIRILRSLPFRTFFFSKLSYCELVGIVNNHKWILTWLLIRTLNYTSVLSCVELDNHHFSSVSGNCLSLIYDISNWLSLLLKLKSLQY